MVSAILAVAAGSLLVGVLEQPQCREGHARSVRVLFEKSATGWKSLAGAPSASAPIPTVWTVAFDGRNLGQIATSDPGWNSEYEWTPPRDRLLDIVGDAPSVRMGSDDFGGWCGSPTLRPLAVVSRPNVGDPSRWKRRRQARDVRGLIFPTFKAHAGRQVTCPLDPEKAVAFDYNAQHLTELARYADVSGRELVAVSLDPTLNKCEGPSEPAWWPHWFIRSGGGSQTEFLGEGLWLVDAGDYDSDGRSELLFWYSGYNRDGYVLFSGALSERVDYLWSYH